MSTNNEGPVQVVVIVLTINQCEKTLCCLKSLQAVKEPPFKVLLWDNGSDDGTVEAVQAQFPNVAVHHHPENLGVAGGRNQAAALAIQLFNPTFLLFIDNDMTVEPGFLKAMIEPFEHSSILAQTTGKILIPGSRNRINDGGGNKINFILGRTSPVGFGEEDRGQYDRPKKCIPGAFSLVKVSVFQEVGGFDLAFNPYGYEDLDFSLRVKKAGYDALYVPGAVAYHEASKTFEGGKYSEKYARNKVKQWFLFLSRHATPIQKLGFYTLGVPYIAFRAVLREARKGNVTAIRGMIRGAFDYLRK